MADFLRQSTVRLDGTSKAHVEKGNVECVSANFNGEVMTVEILKNDSKSKFTRWTTPR